MKKTWGLLLTLALLLLSAAACAEVVGITATATIETPYHQITTLYIEYSEEVAPPSVQDYMIVDFATYQLKEDYEARPFEQAVITAVYTNSEPARLSEKESVPGKYVVIELAPTDGSYFDEVEKLWKPKQIAGLATWRLAGESSESLRRDWSLFVVTQRTDVVNASGEVVAPKGVLPAMSAQDVATPEVACFAQQQIQSANGKYTVYFNLALPENYDPSKTYPAVFCQPGGGGGLDYNQRDAQGNFACLGCDVTRDAVAISFVRYPEEAIVIAVQPWKNAPEAWEVDNVADYIQIIEYVLDNYAVDAERVYALASSQGTVYSSMAITRRPDLFKGYVQCNGSYTSQNEDGESVRFTLYQDEWMISYEGYTAQQIMEISLDPAHYLDADTIAQLGKVFDGVLQYEIPIYFFDGTNTQSGSSLNTTAAYLYLKECYGEKGYSKEQIDELVRLDLEDDDAFHVKGICEYHASSKLAVTEDYDVVEWLMTR